MPQVLAHLHCIAPSGPLLNIERATRGLQWLESQGFVIHNVTAANRQFERFAGTDRERAQEINALAEIVNDDGLIAMGIRGGYGMTRILPQIDWTKLGQAVAKGLSIVGHSDLTALHLGLLAQTRMPSYAGPMVSADFGNESSAEISQFTYQHFIQAVINKKLDIQVEHTQEFYTGPPIEFRKKILWGGNLSMLVSLLGTPYFPSMETIHQGILFIEDINEHPYRVERMLLQLVQAKVLSSQSAILVGDFSGYQLGPLDADYSLLKALGRVAQELQQSGTGTTIISGLPFGHCLDKVTLPVGISCDLDLSSQGFNLSSSW